jgi:hypothetical protein
MAFQPNQTGRLHNNTMSAEQRPTRALVSQAASPHVPWRDTTAQLDAGQVPAAVRRLYAILGRSGVTTLLAGVVLAFLCTGWALWNAVPYPIALLAGYMTVIASACVCAAVVIVRHSAPTAAEEPVVAKSKEPNYPAWKLVDKLRVADAARLWCGFEPGHQATPEVTAWACAILDAVERGELPKAESVGVLAQYKIGWHTEVRRDTLKAWAKSKGHAPRFLCD